MKKWVQGEWSLCSLDENGYVRGQLVIFRDNEEALDGIGNNAAQNLKDAYT